MIAELPEDFKPDHLDIDTFAQENKSPFPVGLVATWWWENALGERRIKEQKHFKLVEIEDVAKERA